MLGLRGALELLDQTQTLSGQAFAGLESAVENAAAQNTLGAPLAFLDLARKRLFLAAAGSRQVGELRLEKRASLIERL